MGCRGCGRRYGHADGCPAKSAAAKKAAATRARRHCFCGASGVAYPNPYPGYPDHVSVLCDRHASN